MIMESERRLILEYGRRLIDSGLTKGTGGNISVFDRKAKLMAITPSGVDYFKIGLSDIVILDLEGQIVDGNLKPSSEYQMHKIFYEKREDINAIVHTHSLYATVLSSLRWDLPPVNYLIALAGENVRCSDYQSFGTLELANSVFEAMTERYAAIIANHGLIAGSYDIHNAFNIAEEIEFCCQIYCISKNMGEPVFLDEKEMKLMVEKFKTYGQIKAQ